MDDKFYYELEGGCEFAIRHVPRHEKKMILSQAQKSGKWNKSNDAFDIDFDVFNRLLILKAVDGWKGLKNRHLKIIFDFEKDWDFEGPLDKGGKKDADFEIPFSEDYKRKLGELHSPDFMQYINFALNTLEDQKKQERNHLLKNL